MFGKLRVFTTCPQSKDHSQHLYKERVLEVAGWSDKAGCTGMLIYSDNSIIDPWLLANFVINETAQLAPLVAVQPVYMHPYTVAKMAATFQFMFYRPVWLNMIAGGFRNDLLALGDPTEHDDRYLRLTEYCQIINRLLAGDTVSLEGRFYQVKNLKLAPLRLPIQANMLMSGSSDASRAAAEAVGAIAVEYPEPPTDDPAHQVQNRGIRVGLIAAKTHEKAWAIANERFPGDRRGQLQHAMAIRTSDSSWQKRLGALAQEEQTGPYWLWPFKNYATFCPYLVGDYDTVAAELGRYVGLGYETFILDIPREPIDLEMATEVFMRAGA
jgi:alkanesulfonate monooxygenase